MRTALTLAAIACLPVNAQTGGAVAPASGQYKIGVVNLKKVFDEYQGQKDEYGVLEKERAELQTRIDALADEVKKLQDKHTEQKEKLPKEELESLEEQILSKASESRAEFKQSQDEIDRKERRVMESLMEDIRAAIQTVGAKENFHMVFESGESSKSGVLYFATPLDITTKIVDQVNANYKKK